MKPNIIMAITAAFIVGILCAGLFPANTTALLLAAVTLAGTAVWQIRQESRYVTATLMGLFFIVGIIRFNHATALSPYDISHFVNQSATIYGLVAELPQATEVDRELVRIRCLVAVEQVEVAGNVRKPATGAVTLTFTRSRVLPQPGYGDNIVVSGKILPLRDYQNPGRIDYPALLRTRGITARIAASADAVSFSPAAAMSVQAVIAKWRQALMDRVFAAMGRGDAAILNGLLFGGYSGIEPEVIKAFAATGIVHLLSVSGSHIALIGALSAWLGGVLGLRRKGCALLAGFSIVVYSLVAGLSPPVVRSLVMGLIALTAVGLGREKNALQALVVAALGMLVYQPTMLWDISFQLSFVSTAGLVLLYEKTFARLAFLPRPAASALSVVLAAQLAILPIIAAYFNTFSFSSFFANMIVVPPLEGVLAIGLVGTVIGAAIPVAGKILLICCAQVIGVSVKLTKLMAALPFSTVHVPSFGIAGGFVYYILLFWAYGYIARLPAPQVVLKRWPYHSTAVMTAAIAALLIQIYYPQPVRVHFIDVGQGDAALVTTPHRHAVLIDSGGSGPLSDFDVGERVVVPYLRHYNVTAIDCLILTHGHKDHAGGAAAVVANMPTDRIIVAREPYGVPVQALAYTARGQDLEEAFTGQSITMDGVEFRFEYCHEDGRPERGNEASNVIRVSFGQQAFLITGDAGAQIEDELLKREVKKCSVLKVAHHGARTSTTPAFLKAYAPLYAVISAGANNQFGHPHAETLERLAVNNIKVYRTDRDGAVVFATDGESLAVETFVKASDSR